MAIPELPINGLETPEYHGLQLTKHDYSLQFPEQAKYDVALQLPERDTAIDAPEYDSGGNAPERDVGREAPEWNIGGEFPGNIARKSWLAPETFNEGNTRTPSKEFLDSKTNKTRPLFRLSQGYIMILLAVLLIVAVIAVTIGVTISRSRSSSTPMSQGNTTRTITPTATSITTLRPLPTPAKAMIANSSSLTAAITVDGAKHIFFQDINGIIRQATADSSSADDWSSNTEIMVASDARNNTPMSAIIRRHSGNSILSPINQIFLFYVTANNSVATKTLRPNTEWSDYQLQWMSASVPYAVAPRFASLSVGLLSDIDPWSTEDPAWKNNAPFGFKIFMLMETSSGVSKVFYGTEGLTSHEFPNTTSYLRMYDITDKLSRAIADGLVGSSAPSTTRQPLDTQSKLNFTSPFTALSPVPVSSLARFGNLSSGYDDNSFIFAIFGSGQQSSDLDSVGFYQFEVAYNVTPGISSSDSVAVAWTNHVNISKTDFALYDQSDLSFVSPDSKNGVYSIWVKSTNLDTFPMGSTTHPNISCPYKRFTTVYPSLGESTIFYLYHQINETFLAEHVFDHLSGTWIQSTEFGLKSS